MRTILFFMVVVGSLSLGQVLAQDTEASDENTLETGPAHGSIKLRRVARGFWRPVFVTHANDDTGRVFVVEQVGRVWIMEGRYNSGKYRQRQPFLDISHLLPPLVFTDVAKEQGLLGLAFHPDYASNGIFFINYSDELGNTVVERLSVSKHDSNRADINSREQILYVNQPHEWHNGGNMVFGPDGFLYLGFGDGGNVGDPLGAGQNRQLLLGSILRLDVDNSETYSIPPNNPFVDDTDALDEIWAYGVRSVWGMSFDRVTGDLYFADVGQYAREEVNFQPAASAGGQNFGWNIWEGTREFAGGDLPDHVPPVWEYDHSKGCSIVGGVLYRGRDIPNLDGVFITGDYCLGTIWATWRDEAGAWHGHEILKTDLRELVGFGQDEAGEVYAIEYGAGTIYRLDPVEAE